MLSVSSCSAVRRVGTLVLLAPTSPLAPPAKRGVFRESIAGCVRCANDQNSCHWQAASATSERQSTIARLTWAVSSCWLFFSRSTSRSSLCALAAPSGTRSTLTELASTEQRCLASTNAASVFKVFLSISRRTGSSQTPPGARVRAAPAPFRLSPPPSLSRSRNCPAEAAATPLLQRSALSHSMPASCHATQPGPVCVNQLID